MSLVKSMLFGLSVLLFAPLTFAGDKPATDTLVGVMVEQFQESCPKPMEVKWDNPHTEVGFVRLSGPAVKAGKKLLGKPVLVKGKPHADAGASRPQFGGGSCMPMQARSDWVFNKTGIRMLRHFPKGVLWVSRFVGQSIEEFKGLSVTRKQNTLTVTFENSTGKALPGVVLTMNYEGCYGKPGAPGVDRPVGTVAPGASITAQFPALLEDERLGRGRGKHAAVHAPSSIQVTTTSRSVVIDLDMPLGFFPGTDSECPRRDRPRKQKVRTHGFSFRFAHHIDGQMYVQLSTGLDSEALSEAIGKVQRVDAHETTAGYSMVAPLPDSLAVKYTTISTKWQAFSGVAKVCTGKLGQPVLVGQVQPHFGELQQFEESGHKLNSRSALEFRKGLLDQSRLFVMAPISGCRPDAVAGYPWAAQSDSIPALKVFIQEDRKHKDWTSKLLAETAWKHGKATVVGAYKKEGQKLAPAEVKIVCTVVDEEAKMVQTQWCAGIASIGSTWCGEGPEEFSHAVLWHQGDVVARPFEPDDAPNIFEPVLVLERVFGSGAYILARTGRLDEELTLFKLEDGQLTPLLQTGTAYNDCPC